MIVAKCSEDDRTISVRQLTQWDYGQVLNICGLNIETDTIQVHFSTDGSENALIVIGRVEDGNIYADIPNSLLKSGRDITAYVYKADKESGKTIYKIVLYVKKRPRPEEYNSPADVNVIEQIWETLNRKADGIKIEGKKVQLLSGENEIGQVAELPEEAGTGEPITEEDINNLF